MAPAQTYRQLQQAALAEEPEALESAARRSWAPKRGLMAALGLAVVGALLLGLGGRAPGPAPLTGSAGAATELVADSDPCDKYEFIKLLDVLHSNLGGHGPDSGAEGLVFKASDRVPGQPEVDLIITVNASASYKRAHTKSNGINGAYGCITVAPGNEADFTFHIFNAKTMKPKEVAKQDFTFFDLDQGASDDNQEYVKVYDAAKSWLTENTEVVKKDKGDSLEFWSSKHGTGHDNPADPTALTVQQKNKAVTVEFVNFDELKFTFGATAGTGVRYFLFVARPSLRCAQTVGGGGDEPKLVSSGPEETTTTAAAPTTTTTAKQCWFTIPFINFCVPKFW